MKKNKTLVVSLIASLILVSVLCVVSIVYNFLGGFYYCRIIEYNNVLGEDLIINVGGIGAYVNACNFSGSMVTDSGVMQRVTIKIGETNAPLYLRAKFGVCDVELENAQMKGYTNWTYGGDGYLYFNQPVNSNESVGLCNEIVTKMQMELKSSKNYVMYFVVETSDVEYITDA